MKSVFSCLAASVSLIFHISPAYGQLTINQAPSREFGQHALTTPPTTFAPNLIEGRELNNPSSVAFDTTVSPPIMYVADTGNNRILAWRNPDSLMPCGVSAPVGCGVASLVIGQADLFSSLTGGPVAGNSTTVGLAAPTAVAVDAAGNLYVADGGNNRILRFPAPFKQTAPIQPDLVIGQSSATAGSLANMGQTQPGAQTLAFCCASSGQLLRTGLAFDASGNLWVADPGNNRVLRFPGPNSASNQLAANTPLPAADFVVGQSDFVTGTLNPSASPTNTTVLANPSGVAIDATSGLYVLDAFSRVLYFTSTGGSLSTTATRILGLTPSAGGSVPNRYSLGVPNQPAAQAIFVSGNQLYVCDSPAHRVVYYDVPGNWPAVTAAVPSPPSIGVIGQADPGGSQPNKGQVEPDATTLNAPVGGAALNGEVWVADSSNNRVLAFASSNGVPSTSASRLAGQLDFPFDTMNLIEGREVFFSTPAGVAGIALDAASSPPHLYVADPGNNRILGFKDARNVTPGTRADIVIGQPDFFRSIANYPSGNPLSPNGSGLLAPSAVAVDSQGNLLVADTGNGRVLRFPSPFSQPAGSMQKASLVIGQNSFSSSISDAGQDTMNSPFGLALFSDGSLAVSDPALNRVLIFQRPPSGDFSNGQAATVVLGQTNFGTSNRGAGNGGLSAPRHMAVDGQNRLYVCDTGNSRVMVFSNARTSVNGANSTLQLGPFSFPSGIAVNLTAGDFWVAATNGQQLLHFPAYDALILGGAAQLNDQTISSNAPAAVAFDAAGNLMVAELVNRISFYYSVLAFRNTANFNNLAAAPGSLVYVARPGADFSFTPASLGTATWPTTMGNLQVVMNGTTLCPMYLVTTTSVYFQVPTSAPTSGFADFQVIEAVTGQIYADSQFPMAPANPGFYTANAQGFGQAAAINVSDGTVNSPANPVRADGKHYVQFYLTGLGAVPGGPPDGVPPPSPVPAPNPLTVLSTGCINGLCPDSSVSFSGLADYPGVWVINFLVPNSFPTSCDNVIAVILNNNVVSNVGPNGKLLVTFCTTTK